MTKKKQGLNKYKNKNKGDRYISPLFLSQKKSNRLIDLGKKIKSLSHFI